MAKEQPQCPVMTNAVGVPVADNLNSQIAGACGLDSVADNPPGAR